MNRREFLVRTAGWSAAVGAPAWSASPCAPSGRDPGGASVETAECGAHVRSLAGQIRAAATATTGPDLPRPLPLAGHWNTGVLRGGFDPDFQVQLLRRGHRILPWFQLYRPDQGSSPAYFLPALGEWSRLGLPISFVGTQWDVLVAEQLAGTPAWRERPDPATTPRPPPLAPDSPLEAWHQAGRRWGSSAMLHRLQAVYPDPPRVLFISNNEQDKRGWTDVRDGRIEFAGLGPESGDEALRRAVGDAWILRYRELLRGFRETLPRTWRDKAMFVGYDAFGQPALGRWGGWPEYSLHTVDRFEPWSDAWDGASVSFYTGDWNPSSDDRVWSPQVEAMNLVPMLEQVRRRHPQFWFEMSTWDGRSDDLAKDKEDAYRARGQAWDASRYAGMVQFGMWLLRPRLVREFRDTVSGRVAYGADFDAILASVDRVHEHAALARFWQHGRLVPNDAGQHPYRSGVPTQWQHLSRWFLLDSAANPPPPWTLETELRIYALALELGARPQREWLVYASSPRQDSTPCDVRVGDRRWSVVARRQGCFNLIRERGAVVEQLEC